MSIRRALSLLSVLGLLVGCAVFTADLSLDELHRLAEREKAQIYFVGDAQPPPKFAKKLGKAEGRVCQTNLIGSVNEFDALNGMWVQAKAKQATAVVEASCASTSFLLPTGGVYCYPGYYCKGEAVK